MEPQACAFQAPIHASLYEKEGRMLVHVGTEVTFWSLNPPQLNNSSASAYCKTASLSDGNPV
jgi:hypothetical protein